MKLRHMTTFFAILAMLGLAACGEEEPEATETPTTEAAPEEAEEATAAAVEEVAAAEPAAAGDGTEAAGGGDLCARAAECCEAFIAGTPGMTAEQACAGVRAAAGTPAADATCQAAIDGWRTGLEASQREVPASCAAAGG